MALSPVLTSALSGLQLQSRRLEVSAHNVANASTDGYRAQTVVAEEIVTGGVTSSVQPTGDPAPFRLEAGDLIEASNTDLATEVVTQISARAAYGANLAALEATLEAEDALLDLFA